MRVNLTERYETLREIAQSGHPLEPLTQEVRMILAAVDRAEQRAQELEKERDDALWDAENHDCPISDAEIDAALEEVDNALAALNEVRSKLLG